jgi:splicing factor 3A subunit 2
MDYQNRAGSKPGSGGVMSASESNVDRRERLKKLAMETIDLAKDPYFMKNHLGSYECKLCLTLHTNEGSYLAHTQGKKHQTNLARRAAKEARDFNQVQPLVASANVPQVRKNFFKIGRPGYKVTKIKEPTTGQVGYLFQIQYPQINLDVEPKYRFMSSYEQHIEQPDKAYQYIIFAAEPYESIAFKVQSREIDKFSDKLFTYWDLDSKQFSFQFLFKNEPRSVAHKDYGNLPTNKSNGANGGLNPYKGRE